MHKLILLIGILFSRQVLCSEYPWVLNGDISMYENFYYKNKNKNSISIEHKDNSYNYIEKRNSVLIKCHYSEDSFLQLNSYYQGLLQKQNVIEQITDLQASSCEFIIISDKTNGYCKNSSNYYTARQSIFFTEAEIHQIKDHDTTDKDIITER